MALLTQRQIAEIYTTKSAIVGKFYYSSEPDPVSKRFIKVTYQGQQDGTLSIYQPAITSSFKPIPNNLNVNVQKAIEELSNRVAISTNNGSGTLSVGQYTAFAGGGQIGATTLNDYANFVTVVASNGDSVKMPTTSTIGVKLVYNNGVNDMDIYPKVGGQFQVFTTLLGLNVPISIATGNSRQFSLLSSGIWVTG